MKTAIVTGLRGQDGSFLAEQLIEQGYKVYGLIRRSSNGLDLGCAKPIQNHPMLEVVEGDITDLASLTHLCKTARSDLFFNMAAQSHVGSSFEQPVYTAEVSGIGVLNCLEAIRLSGIHTRFLQASTSELYGGLYDFPVDEETPFHPRSPYGAAKLYGYAITVNYRESYKMFACNSICFNHECFYSDTPVIIEDSGGDIDIVYVSSLVPGRKDISKDSSVLTKEYTTGTKIWDGTQFVELKAVSRRKLSTLQNIEDQKRQITIAPSVSVSTTPNHKLVKDNAGYTLAKNMHEGSEFILGRYPGCRQSKVVTEELAEFLGLLAGDGYVNTGVRLTNNDESIQIRFVNLARLIYPGITYSISKYVSGFGGTTIHIDLRGISQAQCDVLREMLYETRSKHKKVPAIILNSGPEVQLAFLRGYNLADGLKKDNTVYEFKSFKTNSALLAQGILYLMSNTIGQGYCINTFEQNGKVYHQVNFRSPVNPNNFGSHLTLDSHVVKKVIQRSEDNQHVYDIETESGVVMAGIGIAIVGNSERRGTNFVTRKITQAVARIKAGKQNKVFLGNLDAKRDWGYAPDFTRGMIMMLQASEPDDFVLATGEVHSVREFCQYAFNEAGLNYEDHVEVDPRFYRPAEVNVLIGDHGKISTKLGWTPTITFKHLVELMVRHDILAEQS